MREIKFRAWDGKRMNPPDNSFFYITNSGDALRALDLRWYCNAMDNPHAIYRSQRQERCGDL